MQQKPKHQEKHLLRHLLHKNNKGFTLIEILVALVLITLVFTLAISNPFSSRDDLDQETNNIERALRFMGDEAILRNSVLRLHFILNKDPAEYAVEYGPSDNFILPAEPDSIGGIQSKDEEDKQKKSQKDLNLKFNRVSEFSDKNTELPYGIKILGVATLQSEKLQSTGEVSLYAFPSGERDAALIIIGSDDEIISLKMNAFSPKVSRKIQLIDKGKSQDLAVAQKEMAKAIFEQWKNNK